MDARQTALIKKYDLDTTKTPHTEDYAELRDCCVSIVAQQIVFEIFALYSYDIITDDAGEFVDSRNHSEEYVFVTYLIREDQDFLTQGDFDQQTDLAGMRIYDNFADAYLEMSNKAGAIATHCYG